MRAVVFAFTTIVSLVTIGTVLVSNRPQPIPMYDAGADRALLDQFVASLNADVMKKCVDDQDSGRGVDLDYLSTCGNFDLYARYMNLSKFEAVKKFEYVLLHSSSKLEFEDRLAR